jgi:hemerythrin
VFILWQDKHNTGVEEIDAQHHQLFAILNELHDAKHVVRSQETFDETFSKFIKQIKHHFAFEEAYLERLNYPGLKSHIAGHQRLDKQIETILGFQACHTEDMLLTYLKTWLENHMNEDREALTFKS